LQNTLNDGFGEGLHSSVARVTGHPIVGEGSFRTRCVGGIPAEWAGVDENAAGFLTGLKEHLVLGGIRPETTAHDHERVAFRQGASQDVHHPRLESRLVVLGA
jgi:hypothetical protein